MIVEELIDNLKEILDEPNKRILYKYIRWITSHVTSQITSSIKFIFL